MSDDTETLMHFAEALRRSRATVFFTGAGISTASGIDDFRSPGGVWSRMRPIEFADFLADEAVRLEDWRRRFRFAREFAAARPNVAHRFISERVRAGARLVTQNIDGLHARGGAARERTAELHGTGMSASCLECGVPFDLDDLEQRIETTGRAPTCDRCGGIVKADVVSFGQPMPEAVLERAGRWCAGCDLIVCVGSSLVVNPAARLPMIAQRAGATLAIVNREPTPLDEFADIRLRDEISAVFEALDARFSADP